MTRMFDPLASLCAGAVLICACAGCARDRKTQNAIASPAAVQSTTTVAPSSSYAAYNEPSKPLANPSLVVADAQTTTPTLNAQTATATSENTRDIVYPSSGERMFSPPGSCDKPGCSSCRR
jgi:predicted membrane-bound mannosyltransferase